MYDILLSIGLDSLKALIAHFTAAKAPQEIIDGIQNAYNLLEAHAKDIMSKEQWESLRG